MLLSITQVSGYIYYENNPMNLSVGESNHLQFSTAAVERDNFGERSLLHQAVVSMGVSRFVSLQGCHCLPMGAKKPNSDMIKAAAAYQIDIVVPA